MNSRIILIAALLIGIIGTGLFLNGNGSEGTKTEATLISKTPEQFIVLLDLSDRITQPGQIVADKQLIEKTFEEFEKKVHAHLVINSRDRFQVCIAPQKNLPFDKDVESQNLTLDLSAIKTADRVKRMKEFKNSLGAKLNDLYSKAYIGNDTNEALPGLVTDKITTKLVVLTDGYFDFEKGSPVLTDGKFSTSSAFFSQVRKNLNWKSEIEKNSYGILPIKKSITNLSVCVSEIRSKYDNNLNETDMLKYIWLNWLINSGIPATSCQTILHENISNTDDQLSVFLSRKS